VFVLWLVWAVLTGATGSQSPLFVAREDIGHSFARGDLLVLQWGKAAFENLRAGEVLVYHQMAGDPSPHAHQNHCDSQGFTNISLSLSLF
jgi:hypothetical protein